MRTYCSNKDGKSLLLWIVYVNCFPSTIHFMIKYCLSESNCVFSLSIYYWYLLELCQGMIARPISLTPSLLNRGSLRPRIHKGICVCYILPSVDYSLPLDLEVDIANNSKYLSELRKHFSNVVHAYTNVNASFYGNMSTKYPGRQPNNRM